MAWQALHSNILVHALFQKCINMAKIGIIEMMTSLPAQQAIFNLYL